MASLGSPSQRKKLDPGAEIAWEELARGYALGYRNGWWHRRTRSNGRYVKRRFAQADDELDADGRRVLSYVQAAHRVTAPETEDSESPQANATTYTVRAASRDYLDWFQAARKSHSNTKTTVDHYILPPLGGRLVAELTAREIRRWHQGIARSKAKSRSASVQRYRKVPEGVPKEEIQRKRQSTANRVLTVLKAMLTHAVRENDLDVKQVWRDVKPYQNVERPRIRFLTEAESKRLLNACEPDFRSIVHAAIGTGARYGSLRRMRCEDFDLERETIYIRHAKTAASQKHVPLDDETVSLFESCTAGKLGNEFVFTKGDGNPWKRSEQTRRMIEACETAKLVPLATFHNLKDTFVSHLVKRGVPFKYISDLTGTSVRTLEKFYAHLAESDIRAVLKANAMKLVKKPAKVARMK